MPPPPKEDKGGYPIGTLIGENYIHVGKRVARSGNINELIAIAEAGMKTGGTPFD